MILVDLFEETLTSLLSNRSRSALTILGIVIGIGSVIAMISVGQGATKNISDRIQSLGTNLLVVMPGSGRQAGTIVRGGMGSATTLTVADAEAIKTTVNDVVSVSPTVSSRKQITIKGGNTNTSVYGVDTSYFGIKSITLTEGTEISEQNIKSRSKVAVIGPTTATDLFGEMSPVNQKIRISGQEFLVIGVTEAKGGTGMGSSDDLVYIPLTTAQLYLTGGQTVSNINVQVSAADKMTVVQENITTLLLERHRISNPLSADFSIMNQADMLSAMSSVSGTLTLLLGAIAGISLIVGGIGIMNMMLTTVTERTREIGLRKSVGATSGDIGRQFLAESIILTVVGGIIGIIIGWLASMLIAKFGSITTSVSWSSILLSVGISGIIGVAFGYYPARRASKLDPIEALRYQ